LDNPVAIMPPIPGISPEYAIILTEYSEWIFRVKVSH